MTHPQRLGGPRVAHMSPSAGPRKHVRVDLPGSELVLEGRRVTRISRFSNLDNITLRAPDTPLPALDPGLGWI